MSLADRKTVFSLVVTHALDTTVVAIEGEVDGSTSDDLRTRLDLVVDAAEQPIELVVDLSALSFIDTTGLNVLVRTLKRVRRHGGELTLNAPTTATRKLLAITGLDQVFTVTEL